MIELRFATGEDAEEAVDDLSEFGRPNLDKRVETRFDPSQFLDADYDEAMDELEKLDEELDLEEEENPVKLLKRALKVSKSLFESGDFAKIADARTRGEAGDLLYETVDELRDVEEVKERVGQAMREFVGDFEGLEGEGEDLRNRLEVPEDASDDFGRYSLLMNFLVSPIIDIVDALQVARYDAGLDPVPFNEEAVDVNDDGDINIVDALQIARYDAGLINEL